MSFLLKESMEGKVIEVTVSDRLTKEIYQAFVLRTEAAVRKYGSIRVLFLMLGFRGWEIGATWDDVPFDWELLEEIERLAIVGETKWDHGKFAFCRPFTSATIQYFDQRELEDARTWISK